MLKIFKILLRIAACILLVSVSIAVEFLVILWLDPNIEAFIRYTVHFIVFCLLILLIKPLFPVSWKNKKVFLVSILLFALIITSLRAITYYSDKRLGIKQFNYLLANCFEISRGVLRNDFFSKKFDQVSAILPFSYRYLLVTMGDGCRVLRIKDNLYDDDKRKNICPGESKAECFKKIITSTGQKEAYTITGNVLLVAVGAVSVFDEKKQYDLQDHPLLTDDIRRRNRDVAVFRLSIELFDVLSLVETTYSDEKSILLIFPDFPSDEIALIPDEVKEKIRTTMDKDTESKNDDELWRMLFGAKTKYHDFINGVSSRTIEAYLLMLMNNSISAKLNKVSCESLSKIVEELGRKINDPEFAKSFTQEEFSRLNIKFSNYKNREYCKRMNEVKVLTD